MFIVKTDEGKKQLKKVSKRWQRENITEEFLDKKRRKNVKKVKKLEKYL